MNSYPENLQGNDIPLYNIGVVARLTGVTMATLRAWERRYSFPGSERTAGGHRLYSERDIYQIRWVKARIEQGMQASHAINALHHQEDTGNLALVVRVPGSPEIYPISGKPGDSNLSHYEDRLFDALIHSDLPSADAVLSESLAAASPENIILDVIGPVLSSIGEAWEEGRITVAKEHFATNYLRQHLLMWMVSGPPPLQTDPILLACAPSEWHEGSLLILGALLRRRRWPVAYLGQAVPLNELSNIIIELRPCMVILLAMTIETAAELAEWPGYLPDILPSGPPVIGYGGRVFRLQPELRAKMAGNYLGDTLSEGIDSIERLLT